MENSTVFWRMLSGRNVQLLRYTAYPKCIRTVRIYGKTGGSTNPLRGSVVGGAVELKSRV